MKKSLLIQFLGENPIFKIIDTLMDNKGLELTKKDIIEQAEISRATLFKVWSQIECQEIVKITRKFGKTKLYTINAKNPLVKKLFELERILIGKAIDKRRQIELTVK